MISRSKKSVFYICFGLFFLQFNGYYALLAPVVSSGFASRLFTIPVRGAVLIASLYLLKWFKLPPVGDERRIPVTFLLFFWGVYSMRLFYDAFMLPDTPNVRAQELPIFGIGVCLIPMLAAMTAVRSRQARNYFFWGYFLGSAAFCVLSLLLYRDLLIAGVSRTVGGDVDGTVSSINLGYCSVSTVLLVYSYFMSEKNRLRWLMLAMGVVAMPLMLLSGNRGCLLAFVIAMLPFGFSLFVGKDRIKGMFGIAVGASFVVGYVFWSIHYGGGGLDRLVETFTEVSEGGQGDAGRILLWSTAWKNFLHSPLWGEASIVFYNGGANWAHNIFMDVLNSTGLIGFVSFIYPLFYSLKKAIDHMGHLTEYSWICACFIVGFIAVCISFGAFFASLFWVFFGMVLMIPKIKNS